MVNHVLFGRVVKSADDVTKTHHLQDTGVPEKQINIDAYNLIDKLCEGGQDKLTKFDRQMLNVLYKAVDKI